MARRRDVPCTSSSGDSRLSTCLSTGIVGVDDRTPETARQQAAEGVAQRVQDAYIKIGFDLKNDLKLARAIRDEVDDDVAVRVDANEAWSVFEAVDAVQRFEDVGVEFVEQPINMHDIAGSADLRADPAPVSGPTNRRGSHAGSRGVVQRAADVVVTDPHQLGGLVPFRDTAA